MKMKRFSTLLIIMGVLIICVPVVGTIFNNYQQDRLYSQYKEQLEKQFAELDESFASATSSGAIGENPPKEAEAITGVMGRIKIPAISSDLLLVEGTSPKQLRWGGGHVTGTAMPGEIGNCSIAAHRDYTFGTYFSRLNEVKTGDEIIIDYNGATYKYSVTESFIVLPDEVSVLATTEEAIITLITCHPRGSGKERLIVRGELLD